MKHFRLSFVLLATVLLLALCAPKPQSPVIARVGKAVLTVDDLKRSIPVQYIGSITREQNINYVKQWFDTELLYQEALRRGLHRESDMEKRLETMKRDLLSAELTGRLTTASQNVRFSEDSIQQYYQLHKEEFVLDRDMVRFEQIAVSDCAAAVRLRSTLTPRSFADAAGSADSSRFLAIADLPEEVAAALQNLRVDGISTPVKSDAGCVILHLLDRRSKGSISLFEEARSEIIDRLATQNRRAEVERVLKDLRLRMNCTLNPELITAAEKPAVDSLR